MENPIEYIKNHIKKASLTMRVIIDRNKILIIIFLLVFYLNFIKYRENTFWKITSIKLAHIVPSLVFFVIPVIPVIPVITAIYHCYAVVTYVSLLLIKFTIENLESQKKKNAFHV